MRYNRDRECVITETETDRQTDRQADRQTDRDRGMNEFIELIVSFAYFVEKIKLP